MRRALVFVIPAVTVVTVASAQSSRTPLARGTWAITGATVIPMTTDTVLRDATVLVRDGRIAEIGPSRSVRVPGGARRIDGRGRFVIPGLSDMHAHLYSDGETPDSAAPYELGVMLANGITMTRFMMGTPEQLALRADVIAGRVLGPQLWLASPEFAGRRYGGADFHGFAVTTPEEARAAVNTAADAGYDFIKITLFMQRAPYDALVEEAARRRIPVVGHVSSEVGAPRAMEAGQQLEHLDNFVEQVLHDSAASRPSLSDRGVFMPARWPTIELVDDAKVERFAGQVARAGAWVTPTQNVFTKAFGIGQTDEEMRGRPDWQMIPQHVRAPYLNARTRYWSTAAAERHRLRWVQVRSRLIGAIADSGGAGRILAGSDTPEWFYVYGFALHYELESLVSAGLTPWQALAAATRNPAAFVGSTEFGTLERGKRADLLLLSGNPLEDIRHTRRIELVSIGGRVLERPELERMIAAGSRAIEGAAPASP